MNNPKVATLTFHNALNYGAILQCYALWRLLTDMGCDTEVLDYSCKAIELVNGPNRYLGPKGKIKAFLRHGEKKIRAFQRFKQSHLRMSEQCTHSSIADVSEKYDYIIVGSDQVWNPDLTGSDPTFYLDFISDSKKKKTYAASIGVQKLPNSELDYAELLDGFSSLLLREKTGADLVKDLLPTRNPKVVLDPTLLLDAEMWAQVSSLPPQIGDRPYMLMYAVSEEEKTGLAAKKLAKQLDINLVDLKASDLSWRRTPDAVNIWTASPEEFIGSFQYARAAVVSSFHGVCFSIINHLNFFYALDTEANTKSSRILDLMDALEIEGRNVDDLLSSTYKPLDWPKIDKLLLSMQRESLDLLKESLNEA